MPKQTTDAIRLEVKTLENDLAKITPMGMIANPQIITDPARKCAEIMGQFLDLIDSFLAEKHGGNDG